MIIISGPSTIGKNPLIKRVCQEYKFDYVIPTTTRDMRIEEMNARDYFFLTKAEFQDNIRKGKMNEWDYCLNNYYGFYFSFPGTNCHITHGLSRMALRIKQQYPDDITTVFLMPKDARKIKTTLEDIYTGTDLMLRKALVDEEITHSVLFDHVFEVKDSVCELLQNQRFIALFQNR